jgi:predicted Zn-dependent peptidase
VSARGRSRTPRARIATARRRATALGLVAALVLVGLVGAPAFAAEGTRRERLDNGFTVLVRENPVAPVVALSLLVRMGTRWETPENAGISNFLQAVMVTGTARRSGGELADAVTALGGKLSASGDLDYSEIRASALARFWRELLGLTAELALTPRLAPAEVDRERAWLARRVQRRMDSPASRAFDGFYALLYGAYPYALPTLGTPESLQRIDHAAIAARYRAFYRPDRLVLAVSGQVAAPEVVAEVKRLFGGLPGGSAMDDLALTAPAPLARRPAPSLRQTIEQPAQQAQIVAGGLAPPLDHPDHAPVKVLSGILGGGMAGRLFVELRDRSALAYTASSFYDPVRGPGALILYLGTAPDNAPRAEDGLLREIARILGERVSADELARAKAYMLGRYDMDRRTNERQAWYLAFYEIEGVGLDYPERYRRALEAVTAADVQRVAETYLMPPAILVLRPPSR